MTDRVTLRLRGRMMERFIGRALSEGVRFQRIERTGAREMNLCATEKNAARLLNLAEEYGIDLSVMGEAGRPKLRKRLLERGTLPLGLLLSLMLTTSFTARIWRVEAVSADGAADQGMLQAICQSVSELGARPGKLRSDIDRDALAMQLYAQWPQLTHVSVRTEGVFLRVEVAMEESAPEVYEIEGARDLVASRDAMIVYIEPLAGKARVKAGDIVRQGQTLISGEERIDTEETRSIRALGKVIGRVWFTADCEKPTAQTVMRLTGSRRVRSQVRLGAWVWPLTDAEDFSSQHVETEILPIGGLFLPLRIERTVLWETVEESVLIDQNALREDAAAEALFMAREKLPETAQETDCRVDFSETNGMLTAKATVEAEMDIAAGRGWAVD